MSFFDHFTRPDQHYTTSGYENRLVAATTETEHNETSKYQNLFADCFGHHVHFNLDTQPIITLQQNNIRRFVTSDSLSSYFLDKLYTPPTIYLSANTTPEAEDERTFEYFLRSISDSPLTRATPDGDTEGSNVISFLVGDVGTGKTLLLCKSIREIKRRQRELARDPTTDWLLLPIYFDFETEMKGENGQLLDVDDHFFGRVTNAILRSIAQTHYTKVKLSNLSVAPELSDGTELARLISLIKRLNKHGVRLIVVLDNIDGYHYHYSKYAFFPEYQQQQQRSIQRNITGLITALSHGEHLGMLGLAVVLAARRYVYQDCLHTSIPEASAEFSGAVFQLKDADENEIVTSRLALFEAAIRVIESDTRFQRFGEDYKKTLGRLKLLFGLQELVQPDSARPLAAGAMRTLRNLCHHGNRDLVAFLSNLRLDHREESALIERFFWDKPHTLVLLYIADLCERYTQRHGHFPNLFLVDALVMRDPEFSIAHVPHKHTYWLKYLLLKYVVSRPDGIANTNQIMRLFVSHGGFEEALVRLALGSLSTSRESRCLEPEPGGKSVPTKVAATTRGTFLVSKWSPYQTDFCFSFTYLQLVVDDYLMSYPWSVWESIYTKSTDLKYLFADAMSYGRTNRVYLLKKMQCTLALVNLLKVSLASERQHRAELFRELERIKADIVPSMDLVEAELFEQFKRILSPIGNSEQLLEELRGVSTVYSRDAGALREALEAYYKADTCVEE